MNINQPAENVVLPFRKAKKIDLEDSELVARHRRINIVQALPNVVRTELVAAIGEFVGTFMFLFFAFSATQVRSWQGDGARQRNAL